MTTQEESKIVDAIIHRLSDKGIPLEAVEEICRKYHVALQINDGQVSGLILSQEVA